MSITDKSNFDNHLIIFIMLFADKIRHLREEKQMLQRHLAYALEIDTPMYSRIERGDRFAKREQVVKLSSILDVEKNELLSLWLADKVYDILKNENNAKEILIIVEQALTNYDKI